MADIQWRTFRPLHKWLLIKSDPRVKQTKGGIHLTDELTGVERVMEGTGRILKVGNREEIREATGNMDLEPGMRVCFRGFLKDAFHEFAKDEDGCQIFLLRAEDIMAVVEDEVTMGAFS
jgi:co-chaperonin GroES (HSP10)